MGASSASAAKPVGRVLILGGRGVAVLHDDGTWVVTVDGDPSPQLAQGLVETYANLYTGPQDGDPQVFALKDLAARSRSIVDWLAEPPSPADLLVAY